MSKKFSPLADSVDANQVVIVALNGWTEFAVEKAAFGGCALRLLILEKALGLLVPDRREMCANCKRDCIVLDIDGAVDYGAGSLLWLAGRRRKCRHGFIGAKTVENGKISHPTRT